MNNLNKKQKIILGIISIIIVCAIGYYVYAKDEDIEQIKEEQLQVEENEETNVNKEELYSDDVIKVHISGEVNKEGIIELKPNSRLADAIDKAGGVKENADTDKINLAYILEDGMKICIPNKNEKVTKENKNEVQNSQDITNTYITKSSGVVTNKNSNNEKDNKTSKVNINTATQTELETLPGIGPSTASKIIAYRKEKGKFKNIEELKEVSGIGNSKYDKIKDLVSVK